MKIQAGLFLVFLFALKVTAQQPSAISSTGIDTGYIHVDGGKLYYEAAGVGENIVLLHDGMVHNAVWDGQFQALAKEYRVVRYDRRGYGKSSMPKARFSNIEDLNQLFSQLKIDKAIVFGMSAGGGLAMDFALKYPGKITELVLVGAVVSGYGYSKHMMTRGGHFNNAEYSSSFDARKFIHYFGMEDPYTIFAENKDAKEKFVKLLEASPQNVDQEKFRYDTPSDRPAARFLSEIKVPALIIVGEHDIPDVHAHSGVIEMGIPGAKRIIVNNAGHLVPLEQPDEFNTLVFGFLYGIKFKDILNSDGVAAAVKYSQNKFEVHPGIAFLEKAEIHQLAYGSLEKGNIKEAIDLCKLYTLMYPKSEYAFALLGKAYLQDGQKDSSVICYKKSLEINPQYTNAKEMLEKIEKTR
jgi:3-oxoadipate enol-lactonase